MKIMFKHISALVLFIFFVSENISAQKQNKNFDEVTFDNVFIYEFNPSPDPIYPDKYKNIIGKTFDTSIYVSYKKKTFISTQESKDLYKFLNNKSSFDNGASICWQPHLGIYFLNEGKIVNLIEVCLDCNKLKSVLRVSQSENGKPGSVQYPKGMSSSFRRYINSLLIKYRFDHKLENYNGIWDKNQ